jgi:hypothetical protein
VRLADLQRRKRSDLAWFAAGLIAVQLALAVGVERFWPAIRDPDFNDIAEIVRERTAEAPGRPLVVALGSSRTQMALAAERLNHLSDPGAVVINAAIAGGGPMMHTVVLRRLLRAGLRPQLVFVEIMPMSLSAREGAPVEERQHTQARHTLGELARLWKYYAEHYRLCYPWVVGRIVPAYRYQTELRDALGIDLPVGGRLWRPSMRDDYGWLRCPKGFSTEEVEFRTRDNLESYAGALTQPALAPGALRALRDVVQLCLVQGIAVVLYVPAESSAFRNYAPAVEEIQMSAVRQLAHELAVPLIDARTWVDDAHFYDGHHVTHAGAEEFTERFGREALQVYCPR